MIALRYLLGYPTKRIARFMGLDTRTVDYHGRKGKERLRIRLGLPAPDSKNRKGAGR
ncbi:sigma factor-like helix-turn-helix DNA-binding protein [Streptomyces geysiriensis]|uniref:sigma factor-like helix-turn-helix DNA-binding protein n=1 Tax=Streptomyces geysiriensis TaxID=68207 RepID=UPI0027DEFF49|nr:sigma factor-like helix-turn-helix DNA-binding protein [Streptomyces geysiriensis]